WLVACVLLCLATFGIVFLATDPLHLMGASDNNTPTTGPRPPKTPADQLVAPVQGENAGPLQIKVYPPNSQMGRLSQIVITGGTVVASYKQEVPSERPGRVLLVARE